MLTDHEGKVKDSYAYDAFGVAYEGQFQRINECCYNVKCFDPAAELYDYGFRDYKPMLGRFTTLDPIRDINNWYVYVNNDPVNFIDPLGLLPETPGTGQVNEPSVTQVPEGPPIQEGVIPGEPPVEYRVEIAQGVPGKVDTSVLTSDPADVEITTTVVTKDSTGTENIISQESEEYGGEPTTAESTTVETPEGSTIISAHSVFIITTTEGSSISGTVVLDTNPEQ